MLKYVPFMALFLLPFCTHSQEWQMGFYLNDIHTDTDPIQFDSILVFARNLNKIKSPEFFIRHERAIGEKLNYSIGITYQNQAVSLSATSLFVDTISLNRESWASGLYYRSFTFPIDINYRLFVKKTFTLHVYGGFSGSFQFDRRGPGLAEPSSPTRIYMHEMFDELPSTIKDWYWTMQLGVQVLYSRYSFRIRILNQLTESIMNDFSFRGNESKTGLRISGISYGFAYTFSKKRK